jgi:hypothetical protein
VLLSNPFFLAFIAALIFAVIVLPSFLRWVKTVRCPKCGKWFKLEYDGFNARERVVGRSSPFVMEWGTACFYCRRCGHDIEVDAQRNRECIEL